MATIFGERYTRREIESLVGDVSQVAGITPVELADGRARGVRAAEVLTGSGLSFIVALDRCMDISRADFCGRSLCWRSFVRETGAAWSEEPGLGWLQGFAGGLLTTCGLTYCGAPCADRGEPLGLHGRISAAPAERVCVVEEWQGNEYVMLLSGEMREGRTFGTCLRMRRTIATALGARSLLIRDEVTNVGPRPGPLMLLYHCNIGFPALAPGSRLLAPSITVHPNTPDAEEGKREYAMADAPARGRREKVYEHSLAAKRGGTAVALVNDSFDGGKGFGVYLRFRTDQLPVFTQWKMMGESEYVMGMEPGTNGVRGRAWERERGRLKQIRPGQTRVHELEIGVLDGAREIGAIEKEIRSIRRARPKIGNVL